MRELQRLRKEVKLNITELRRKTRILPNKEQAKMVWEGVQLDLDKAYIQIIVCLRTASFV